MKRLLRSAVSVLVLASTLGIVHAPDSEAASRTTKVVTTPSQAQLFVDDVNVWRVAAGEQPLTLVTDQAVQAVIQKTVDAQPDSLSLHHSTTFVQDLSDVGCSAAGEVLAAAGTSGDFYDAHKAASMWWLSDPHRAILMNPNATKVVFGYRTYTTTWEGIEGHWTVWGANTMWSCSPPAPVPVPVPAPVTTPGPTNSTTPVPQVTPSQPRIAHRHARKVRH